MNVQFLRGGEKGAKEVSTFPAPWKIAPIKA